MHDMPGHDMPDMCSMSMLFTWDWKNTCIIYKWWHIRTVTDFLLSFVAVVALSAGYEFIKYWFTKWDNAQGVLVLGSSSGASSVALRRYNVKRAVFYGLQVGYSFMLMLVFMTYNGWFMLATVAGAIVGKYVWGVNQVDERTMACH